MTSPMPSRPHFDAATIPAMLRALPRWVLWRYELREGKWTKIPYQPSGHKAKANTLTTWATFEDAHAAYQHDTTRYMGLGIMLNGDGLIGLDYDDCIADDGTIAPEVLADLAALGTYAERSPSGRGVRVFLLNHTGGAPGWHKNSAARFTLPTGETMAGAIENYATGRYLTVTGNRIAGQPDTIEGHPDALAAWFEQWAPQSTRHRAGIATPLPILTLDDEQVLANARRMHGFRRLYDGADTGAYADDDSSADLGLLNYLVMAGATDPAQLDRLYRSSPLARSKWDERRGASTYGRNTIARALDGTVQPFEGFAPRPSIRLGEISSTRFAPNPQDAGTVTDHGGDAEDMDDLNLPDDPATLKQYIRELSRRIEQMRQEQERMQQRLVMLSDVQSRAAAIQRNKAIGQLRPVAVAVVNLLANRETADTQPADGMHRIHLKSFGEAAGVSDDTASKKLTILSESGVGLRKQTRTEHREDGTLARRLYIGLEPGTSVVDFAAAVAAMDCEQRPWGGRRVSCPTCGPDAEIEKRTTMICRGCGEVLAERVHVLPLAEPSPHLAGTVGQPTEGARPLEANPQDAGLERTRTQRAPLPPVVSHIPLSSGTVNPPASPSLPLSSPSLDRYTDPLYGRTG